MDNFDQLSDLGRALGMNEATARQFAIGRYGSEAQARQRLSPPAADLTAAQADATEAAIEAEVSVLGRTRQQASEHVRSMARDAGARQGAAYAVQLVGEYARALRSPGR